MHIERVLCAGYVYEFFPNSALLRNVPKSGSFYTFDIFRHFCHRNFLTSPSAIPVITQKKPAPLQGQTFSVSAHRRSVPSALCLFLLPPQFKPALSFCPLFIAALCLAHLFVLLLLQFQSLLRFRPESGFAKLLLHFSLYPLRVLRRLFHCCRYSRAELQIIVMIQDESVYILFSRLRSERHLRRRKLSARDTFEHSCPERILKIHRKSAIYIAHNYPSSLIEMDKEWTTRRGRLLTLRSALPYDLQDGRATYRLWHAAEAHVAFLSLSF